MNTSAHTKYEEVKNLPLTPIIRAFKIKRQSCGLVNQPPKIINLTKHLDSAKSRLPQIEVAT